MLGISTKRMIDIREMAHYYDVAYIIEYYFILFIMASFVGWVSEGICFRIMDGIWVNRGLLLGPELPVYGIGALAASLISIALKKHPFLYFLAAGAVCTVIEYTIAEILEYKYGMQLWDYTDNIVNFRGKISLLSSLAFAGGCMALAYLVEPLYRLIVTHKVPRHAYDAVACALLMLFISDMLITFMAVIYSAG